MSTKRAGIFSSGLRRWLKNWTDAGYTEVTLPVSWYSEVIEAIEAENDLMYRRGLAAGLAEGKAIHDAVYGPRS